MKKPRFVGLGVHKDTIVIAVAEEGQAEAESLVTLPHDVPKVRFRVGSGPGLATAGDVIFPTEARCLVDHETVSHLRCSGLFDPSSHSHHSNF